MLIIGSGFATHGLPFLRNWRPESAPLSWSVDFGTLVDESLTRGSIDNLVDFEHRAPDMPYAHRTVERFRRSS